MNFLRLEFKNNQFVKMTGDLEDFIEWLGGDPSGLSYSEFFYTLPVFERLGIDFRLNKVGNWPRNKKRQATVFVMKSTPFFKMFTHVSGKRTYSKRAAVVSALLALWELETFRKVNAVKEAFGVGNIEEWRYTPGYALHVPY